MIGFKKIISIFLIFIVFGNCYYTNDKGMEINRYLKTEQDINVLVSKHFLKSDYSYINPIFPYKINYSSKNLKLSFCNIPVIESWVLKNGHFFTFFILVENDSIIVKSISNVYGNHDTESNVEINDNPNSPITYYWHLKELNIILRKFYNVRQINKYNNCSMIIIGNMDYKSIVQLGSVQD